MDSSGSIAELDTKLLTSNLQIGIATIYTTTVSRDHLPTTIPNSCMCRAAKVMELAGMLEEGERQRTARAAAVRQRSARALALRAVRPQSATASFKTTTRDQVRGGGGGKKMHRGGAHRPASLLGDAQRGEHRDVFSLPISP